MQYNTLMRSYLIRFVLWYLRVFAHLALFLTKPYIIGIAGSVGKSSTRNALYAILKEHYKVKLLEGNSETGIPLSILNIDMPGFDKRNWMKALIDAPKGIFHLKGAEYLIIEMGIDDPEPPKNMEYLLRFIKPQMSIYLNAAGPHLMQFEKTLTHAPKTIHNDPQKRLDYILKRMAEEDARIITKSGCKIGIYNNDNIYAKEAVEKKKLKHTELLTFGKNKTNSIYYAGYDVTGKRTKFSFSIDEKNIELTFRGFILPPAYLETFSAVILAAKSLGLTLTTIKETIEKNFTLPRGRSSLLQGINNSIIIDSSYNAPKLAVLSLIDMVKDLSEKTNKPSIAIIGDMRELGNEAEIEHQEVARKLLKSVDEVYCVGPLTQEYIIPLLKEKFGKKSNRLKRVEWYKNAVQLGLHLKEQLPKDAIVLVKGSQNEIFLEEAIKFILEDNNDIKQLTRQSEFWLKKKKEFFSL